MQFKKTWKEFGNGDQEPLLEGFTEKRAITNRTSNLPRGKHKRGQRITYSPQKYPKNTHAGPDSTRPIKKEMNRGPFQRTQI